MYALCHRLAARLVWPRKRAPSRFGYCDAGGHSLEACWLLSEFALHAHTVVRQLHVQKTGSHLTFFRVDRV